MGTGLIAGDAGCTIGLSSRYYEAKKTRAQASSSWSKMTTDQQNQLLDGLKNDCYDQAVAVVAEIQANAGISVSTLTGTSAGVVPGALAITPISLSAGSVL
jgi:hypothetical protein